MFEDTDLAAKIREVRLREASGVDEERVRQALEAKAGLGDRVLALLEEDGAADLAYHATGRDRTPWSPSESARAERSPVDGLPPEAGASAVDGATGAGPADGLSSTSTAAGGAFPTPHRRPAFDYLPVPTAPVARPDDEDAGPERSKRSLMEWFLGRERRAAGHGAITVIPPLASDQEEVETYAIEEGFSYVRVERHTGTGELLYRIIEPRLVPHEREILGFVEDALVRGLDVDPSRLDPTGRARYLEEAMDRILHDYRIRIDERGLRRIGYFLRRDFLGLGPIHPLMLDPDLEDISCDGAGIPVFVFHRRHESIPSTLVFSDDTELDGFVIRLAQRSGRAISISDPILDAALPDGSRLQATLGREVTQNGSTFTIRRFKPDPFTAVDLLSFGTLDPEMLAWFWLNAQHGHSMLLAGGTASGKTTSLNALAQFIPPHAKIVSIEDTREVNLPHLNWIKSVTRSGSTGEGTGEIGMFELLKASLRQRPEFILVGEVRGVEATVAFQAMATGHTVYSTIHADSARSVVYRLENDPINVPRLVLQALDIIAIQAQRRFQGRRVRRLTEVVELVGIDATTRELLTNTVFRWDGGTDRFHYNGRSYLLQQIAQQRNWPLADVHKEMKRRAALLERLLALGGSGASPVFTEVVRLYYRDPAEAERVVAMAEAQRHTSQAEARQVATRAADLPAGSAADLVDSPTSPEDAPDPSEARLQEA